MNSTPEGVVGILAGGSADVGVSYEPNVSVLVKSGGGKRFHVVMSSREARGMITDVLVLKDSVIAKNPQLVDGLIRGTLDGLAFMKADPAKSAAILAKTLEISIAEVQDQLPNIENTAARQPRRCVQARRRAAVVLCERQGHRRYSEA